MVHDPCELPPPVSSLTKTFSVEGSSTGTTVAMVKKESISMSVGEGELEAVEDG